jgi:3-oxoacyl-[acyl-carrier protein] reductase
MSSTTNFSDKVAIITGSGQGIGKAIAVALGREGAKVVLADIASDLVSAVSKEIEALGSRTFPVMCDVTSRESVENMTRSVLDNYGRIDILVNNAGIYPSKPFVEITEKDWDNVFNVNIKGVFNCTQKALPIMKGQRYGRIINISSIAGAVIGYENLVHYSATKAAIVGFTRSLALEVARDGILVNAIAPGAIETPTATAATETMHKELAKQIIAAIPLGRWRRAEEIARAVLFLAGEDSSYMTGQCLVIDGGLTIQ